MIDHVWTVICSRSVIDRRTNNISLQNVLEQLTVTGDPETGALVPERLDAASFWTRAEPDVPCQGRMRLSFQAPSGKVFGPSELPIDLSQHERHRTQVCFRALPAEEPGRHYFYVDLQNEGQSEWHRVAAIPLTILFKPPDEDRQQEEPAQGHG